MFSLHFSLSVNTISQCDGWKLKCRTALPTLTALIMMRGLVVTVFLFLQTKAVSVTVFALMRKVECNFVA